jgi:hypothetical protein
LLLPSVAALSVSVNMISFIIFLHYLLCTNGKAELYFKGFGLRFSEDIICPDSISNEVKIIKINLKRINVII